MTNPKTTSNRRGPFNISISPSIALPVSLLIAGCASTPSAAPDELRLTSQTFGSEQQMLYGVGSGIVFVPNPNIVVASDENPESGVLQVRDKDIGIVRVLRGGEAVFAVDTNRDGSFVDEQFAPADGAVVSRTIEFDGERVPVEFNVSPEGRGEFGVRELWQLAMTRGNESLVLGILRIGTGIIFADTDSDGIFETYMPRENPLSLGGRIWELDYDFETREAKLVPSDQTPVAAGFEAPIANGTGLDSGESVNLVGDGTATVLVFCHAGCRGCRVISESLEAVSTRYEGDASVRLINVARSEEEARDCREVVCPSFTQVVAPDAWGAYVVTPTPTIVVVDGDGVIRYRGNGAGEGTADLLYDVLEGIR